MTQVKASIRFLPMAPRKVRAVADVVRSMDAETARLQLRHSPRRAARPMLKLLQSAIANAKQNFFLQPEELRIASLTVDMGPALKRTFPRARGSASIIRRRTSHVRLTLVPKTAEAEKRSAKERAERMAQGLAPVVETAAAASMEGAQKERRKGPARGRSQEQVRPALSREKLKGIGKRIFRRKSV